jgi:hypothetical protein
MVSGYERGWGLHRSGVRRARKVAVNLRRTSIQYIGAVVRTSKRNFAMLSKTALGLQGQTETSLKIADLS